LSELETGRIVKAPVRHHEAALPSRLFTHLAALLLGWLSTHQEVAMAAEVPTNSGEAQAQRLESVYEQLSRLLHHPDVVQHLRTAPGEHEWSALQVIGHMVEMIPYWLHHCHHLIAASGEPPQFGRTLDAPERLAGVESVTTRDANELLDQLKQVAEAAARDIRRMSEFERSKTGIHLRQGQMTVADVIEQLIIGHAEAHLVQVQQALKI
jgi:hypothetical protein